MKKAIFTFKTCLFAILLSACSEDDNLESNTDKFVTNISLEKQNAFTDEEIKLTFDAKNYDSISVSSEETSIDLTPISVTSYRITSNQQSSGYIDIFTRKITTSNDTIDQLEQVFVKFHERGTTNYQLIDGIDINNSNIYNLLLIHGKPEGITTETIENTTTDPDTEETTTVVNVYEHWHYLSKGFSFRSLKHTGNIISVTVYGTEWEVTLDNGTTATGAKYPYEIGAIGNFTNGIIVDDILSLYNGTIVISQNGNLKRFRILDFNASLADNQTLNLYFTSDNNFNHDGETDFDFTAYKDESVDYITFEH
ncbi:hypothetical protein AXE80_12145 [Wenyingzhuangia fucanilytica]|uniref:Lipoprotein n=1 Tax=Wenyingzhuangia fucanilytica TaxID=1790137 RepID=A0A1B1Y8B5_9FLAO|nr:hypothetical protein [Wenyingzhuangia fucanilytica]ANW96984.1 hypothetical protein AXE80_12145 [Wenyingzhuangia fucanilytica]